MTTFFFFNRKGLKTTCQTKRERLDLGISVRETCPQTTRERRPQEEFCLSDVTTCQTKRERLDLGISVRETCQTKRERLDLGISVRETCPQTTRERRPQEEFCLNDVVSPEPKPGLLTTREIKRERLDLGRSVLACPPTKRETHPQAVIDLGPPEPESEMHIANFESEDIKLYRAILSGDWKTAKEVFVMNKAVLTNKLDDTGDTALHIAILRDKNIGFVEKLLEEINPKLLTTVNKHQSTALHYAALVGNTVAATMLVDKNKHCLFIKDNDGELPIHTAIINSQRETFKYMLHVSRQHIELSKEGYQDPFEGENGDMLLASVIREGMVEEASELMRYYPNIGRGISGLLIERMAENVDLYYSGTRYNFLQRFLYLLIPTDTENPEMNTDTIITRCMRTCASFDTVIQWIYINFWRIILLVPHIKRLEKDKVKHKTSATLLKRLCGAVKIKSHREIPECYFKAIYLAVENDIPEVAEDILNYCPQVLWRDDDKPSVIEVAIKNRNEKVYNLLVHSMCTINTFLLKSIKIDDEENNLGHLAGRKAPIHKLNLVSGAALQMQRELQWFQEVKKFLRPAAKEAENKEEQTPIEVFRTEHKELRKDGEEWMKKTADSYTITAALIITIAFAAAITVPGGINGESGKAIFEANPCFIIFVVSDTVSMFTSTTSLLLFLSILTARYSEDDFLYKLPKRLIMGLVMLFLSVTSMVVAFSAALFILVGYGKGWILISVLTLACLPITSFVTLQFPLLWDLYSSTYGRGIFYKQNKYRNFLRSCMGFFSRKDQRNRYHLQKDQRNF